MNLVFLFLVAGLMAIALLLILPPIWRDKAVKADDADQRNVLIARQRLAELKANRQAGGISQEQYDEQVAELERSLLDDLSLSRPANPATTPGRWMVFALALFIPAFSAALYSVLGNFQAIEHGAEMSAASSPNPSPEQIVQMVESLAERMKSDPDNVEGWLMLGKSYQYMTQFDKAADAFANAYRLQGDRPDIMLQYAEALAFAHQKNMAGKPSELVFKALSLEPENPNGLWLGGLAKVQQGDVTGALALWSKLESLLPEDSEARREVRNIIAGVSGKPASGNSEIDQTAKPSTVSVSVEVSLTPELKASTNPADTVFVYAQALSGPKMPLAIVRKQVADLPFKVTLDDSQAMMPAMKLSNFGTVKLLARISKSGQASSQSGDLIGTLDHVELSDPSSRKIVIDELVK